jgi:hypothetical protein
MAMEPVGHIVGQSGCGNRMYSTIMADPLSIFIGRLTTTALHIVYRLWFAQHYISPTFYLKKGREKRFS